MIREKIIVGKGTKYALNGILTLPDSKECPVPAVVLVHGSGASNMDERIMKLTPFKEIAEGLAAHGIASIRYDKRTYAHPIRLLTDKSQPMTVQAETIDDAILATELLRKDPRIDPDRIFIIGHSMGGMLAPRIDAEGGNYRGIIIMAGSPRRLEEILVEQLDEMLAGMSKPLRKLAGKSVNKMTSKFDGMYELSDEEACKVKLGGGTTLYYFKEMGEPPVSYYLERTDKPLLIMQGAKDLQVKLDRDFETYKELLCGRENAIFKLYENLNHAFVDAIYDNISMSKKEYAKERHIGDEVITDVAEWINSTARK